MNNTQRLHELGQSLWLDNISRPMLTGLTSNPTIFDEAIGAEDAYDDGIRAKARAGKSGEALFVELALEDPRRAADLFQPIFDATDHVDGWVSMELSPLLAANTADSIKAAAQIYKQADRPNLFIKIPGTPEGIPAIEESDPAARDTLYVEALAARDTINTMPKKTLRAFAEHGELKGVMAEVGGDAEETLKRFAQAGIDIDALAVQLQKEGAQAFVKSWKALLQRIADKSEALVEAGTRNG